DPRRARAAALLPPRLVAARRRQPRARLRRPDFALDARRLQLERAGGDRRLRAFDLREHVVDVDAAVLGRERGQPPRGLFELAPGRHRPAAPGLVPGDRDVDEPLEEVALL